MTNDDNDSLPGPSKHAKIGETCITHYANNDKDTNLVSPKDYVSWQSLLATADIRQHKPILEIANSLPKEYLPKIDYHRQCQSIYNKKIIGGNLERKG